MTPKGYFYSDGNMVHLRTTDNLPIMHIKVCLCETEEKASILASKLNRDIDQLDTPSLFPVGGELNGT